MRVDSVTFNRRTMSSPKLARYVCKTKTLPANISNASANKILRKGEYRHIGAILGTLVLGIGSGTALAANFAGSNYLLAALGQGITFASLLTATEFSAKKRKIEKAYRILNGKDVLDPIDKREEV